MPLPPETLASIREDIKAAEAALKEANTEIERGHLAGIDMTEERKVAKELADKIRQLKSVYGRG